jgi:hypothetical protein
MVKRLFKTPFKRLNRVILTFLSGLKSAFEPALHPRRYRQEKRANRNQDFLKGLGFREVGDGDLSYIDAKGNALRVVQSDAAQITLIVIGRRRSRAYLKLDKKGRYASYTGPIRI